MSRSSDRGQTEPIAALVAVVAVGFGLGLYAGVLDAEIPAPRDPDVARAAAQSVEDAVAPAGVAIPARLDAARDAGPAGYRTNATVVADGERWASGPAPPEAADRATSRLGVRVRPAMVEVGELRVTVWR